MTTGQNLHTSFWLHMFQIIVFLHYNHPYNARLYKTHSQSKTTSHAFMAQQCVSYHNGQQEHSWMHSHSSTPSLILILNKRSLCTSISDYEPHKTISLNTNYIYRQLKFLLASSPTYKAIPMPSLWKRKNKGKLEWKETMILNNVLNVLLLQILYIWPFKCPFSLSIINLMVNLC